MLKGIYLGAYKAYHPNYDIDYQDINGLRDIDGDMMDIDLSSYDYIIATPPCNYWSRARGKRVSQYSLDTKHLLPDILEKLRNSNKLFIVENVRNDIRFKEYGLLDYKDILIYKVGRHTYWTNVFFNTLKEQSFDFKYHGYRLNNNTQGGDNVYNIIESWLKQIHSENYIYIC